MGLFASVTIATSLHLAWAHSHMRPNVELTDGLQARISEQSIVSRLVDYRIAAANGQTVSDLQQLDAVIGAGSRRHLLARVVPVGPGAGQRKRAFWWERREAPRFELDGAGVILGVDPALPDGAPTVVGARLTHLNGSPLVELTDPASVLRSNVSTLALTLRPSDDAQEPLDGSCQ